MTVPTIPTFLVFIPLACFSILLTVLSFACCFPILLAVRGKEGKVAG